MGRRIQTADLRHDCAICNDVLFKRIRCFEDGPLYMHHKDIPAPDDSYDANPDYAVIALWCITCGILYQHDP